MTRLAAAGFLIVMSLESFRGRPEGPRHGGLKVRATSRSPPNPLYLLAADLLAERHHRRELEPVLLPDLSDLIKPRSVDLPPEREVVLPTLKRRKDRLAKTRKRNVSRQPEAQSPVYVAGHEDFAGCND